MTMIATLRFLAGKPATSSSGSSSSNAFSIRSAAASCLLRKSTGSIKNKDDDDDVDFYEYGKCNAKWYDKDEWDAQSDTTNRFTESCRDFSSSDSFHTVISSPLNVLQRKRLSMDRTKALFGHMEQQVEIQQIFHGKRIVAIRHQDG